MGAYANEWHGAPIAAADDAKTGGLGEESNKEWPPQAARSLWVAGENAHRCVAKSRRVPDPPEAQHLALGVFARATRLCP